MLALVLLIASLSTASVDAQKRSQVGRRTVAVTFDDLAVISLRGNLASQASLVIR